MIGRILFLLATVATVAFACNQPYYYGGEEYTDPYSPEAVIRARIAPSNGSEVTLEVYNVMGVQMGRTSVGVIDTTTTCKIEDVWQVTTDSLGHTDSTLVHLGNFDSGIYFYVVRVGDSTVVTKKAVLLR